jgi:hypothetical protein
MSGNNAAADHEGQNGEAEVVLVETEAGEVTVDSATGEVLETVSADLELARDERCEAVTHAGGNLYQCALSAEHEGEHSFSVVDETAAPEPEPEPEPADDAQVQALFRAVKNYSKAVVGVLGADLGDFTLCPCCDPRTPGLYLEHPHSDEQMAALRAIVGLPSLENYRRDNRYSPCATCDGLGTVLTGSRVPAHMTGRCVDCNGSGYISHDAGRPTPEPAPILSALGNGGELSPDDPPAFDPWGRPYGDPDYYRMPVPGATV